MEKLPSELRILCGDYACCEEGSIVDFHHALMKMQMHLAEEKEREEETEELISVSFLRFAFPRLSSGVLTFAWLSRVP